jgi:hypothetical protein
LATDQTSSHPSEPGVGQPSRDAFRTSDIVLTEIAKLQNDGEYTKRDLGEMRTDMRDVRDRLTRLEERVGHLPRKGFIIVVVTTSLLIVGGLLTIAPRLQGLVGLSSAPIAASNPLQGR